MNYEKLKFSLMYSLFFLLALSIVTGLLGLLIFWSGNYFPLILAGIIFLLVFVSAWIGYDDFNNEESNEGK